MSDNRTTEQTVTERLRALLTERRIKFKAWDGVHPITVWHDEQFSYEYTERSLLDGVKPHTGEVLDGTGFLKAVIHVCTPEQAIAATLGNSRAERTCKCIAEYAKSPIDGKTIVLHRCSSCHELMRPHMNYCPNCGARRVDE